ncbi:protein-L-isoaspartate O-methyltransferase [Candidatus Pacearchaeota archaeon]|nr:protein-L-isoaspartate O-methyltransferase [Candidatus Pacearchaeota archaeon]
MEKDNLLESLKKQGYSDEILSAFANIKREKFLPENIVSYAYDDIALPIESGSTISQPSTIAFMLSILELKPKIKVLEIGSGSGYALSLISEIIKEGEIYGIEIIKRLAVKSSDLLRDDKKIKIFNKEGSLGLPKFAPFDRILISASCPDMRIPYNLVEQLSEGGILVAAVKQSIFQIKKENAKLIEKEFPGFAFIPLRKEE